MNNSYLTIFEGIKNEAQRISNSMKKITTLKPIK